MNVCWFCNHVKEAENSAVAYNSAYCEVLKKQGKNCTLESVPCGFGIDRSKECEKSFAWNCDMKQIIDAIKSLSDRYEELYNAELKIMVVRQGNTADGLRVMKQPQE